MNEDKRHAIIRSRDVSCNRSFEDAKSESNKLTNGENHAGILSNMPQEIIDKFLDAAKRHNAYVNKWVDDIIELISKVQPSEIKYIEDQDNGGQATMSFLISIPSIVAEDRQILQSVAERLGDRYIITPVDTPVIKSSISINKSSVCDIMISLLLTENERDLVRANTHGAIGPDGMIKNHSDYKKE